MTLFTSFPFWCGIIWRRGTTLGAWVSVIGTFIVWLAMEFFCKGFFENSYMFNATEFLVCIPTGFIFFVIFSYLSKPEDDSKLDAFYSRLKTPVGQDKELDAL
jgi:Na+/proline symporter